MSLDTHHLEMILLRSILKCFGKEYKIISEDDWWRDCGTCNGTQDLTNVTDIRVKTNLPDMIQIYFTRFNKFNVYEKV